MGTCIAPTPTSFPFGTILLSAPPQPVEPLPDATNQPPPYSGWYSFESDHPAVQYSTPWSPRLHTNASRGQYHRSENVQSHVSFPFEGEGLRIRYVAALPPLEIPPTPYIIAPPQDFYVGDAVFVGSQGAPLHLRFRLQNVQVQPAKTGALVTWQLEIHNIGTMTYETIPPALVLITQITTANGEQTGTWRTSEAVMHAAGFTDESYDPLSSGATRLYGLAAHIPTGNVNQFTYLLDGESNRITWTNQSNPYCAGDIAD